MNDTDKLIDSLIELMNDMYSNSFAVVKHVEDTENKNEETDVILVEIAHIGRHMRRITQAIVRLNDRGRNQHDRSA